MSLIGVVPTALVAGCAAVVSSQDRPGSRVKASLAAAGAALVLTVPLTLAAGVTGAAAVAYVISPIVEVIVLASQAGARLAHLGLRIARIGVPLAAVSLLLGHLTTSPCHICRRDCAGWPRRAGRARNDGDANSCGAYGARSARNRQPCPKRLHPRLSAAGARRHPVAPVSNPVAEAASSRRGPSSATKH